MNIDFSNKITAFIPKKQNSQNDKRVMLLSQEWANADVQKTNLRHVSEF
jgi:hypothetical protein